MNKTHHYKSKLLDALDRCCFSPKAPSDLGIGRFLFFFMIYRYFVDRYFLTLPLLADAPRALWSPLSVHWLFGLPPPGAQALRWLALAFKASLAFSCVGFLTGLSTVFSFLLGTYLFSLSLCFGATRMHEGLPVLIMGILAFSRCGDAWSVDTLLKRVLLRTETPPKFVLQGEYTWPNRSIRALWVMTFFSAALCKLETSGIGWVNSGAVGRWMLDSSYYFGGASSELGKKLAHLILSDERLSRFLSTIGLLMEVLAPLALFSIWTRAVLIPLLIMFLFAVRFVTGVDFVTTFIPGVVFWIPWNQVGRAIRAPFDARKNAKQ